jgi:hypothetical protein
VKSTPGPEQKLTASERRLFVEVDRILYQNYFSSRTVTDFWVGDGDAIIGHLKQMKDRVIRSIVIMENVEVDDVLNRVIEGHFFPRGRRQRRRNRAHGTLQLMLDRLYPIQKLELVRSFRTVPDKIRNHVLALNDLRSTYAHRFHLHAVPRVKRRYKGRYDVFTKGGLERFRADMWEVHEFLDPQATAASLKLVKDQRERNR